MADNRQIKDGLGNLFTLRMRDISPGLDGTVQRSMFYSTPYPVDYGGGGIFQYRAKTGTFLTGLPVGSTIFSFWWPISQMLALITRVRLNAMTTTVFSGGIATFDLFVARSFNVADSGGIIANLTGNNNQLRTAMSASQASLMWSNTSGLTPGTRTLDPAPLDGRMLAVPTTANTLFSAAPVPLFEKTNGEHPLVLQSFEGFVILASVPSDGAWQCVITLDWAEAPSF